jgi:hypothetical protein
MPFSFLVGLAEEVMVIFGHYKEVNFSSTREKKMLHRYGGTHEALVNVPSGA